MGKSLRVLACIVLVGMTANALADLTVSISDGPHTVGPGAPGFFNLITSSPAPGDTVLPLLNCAHPCRVFFPSGQTSVQTGDTFVFTDTCGGAGKPCVTSTVAASTVARVVKTDLPNPHIAIRGVQITSLVPGSDAWLRVTASTGKGGLSHVAKDGSYPVSGLLAGSFVDNSSGVITVSCPDPDLGLTELDLMTPCASLLVNVDSKNINELGRDSIATVSIPCWNSDLGFRTSYCNVPLGQYLSGGIFNALDESRFSCSNPLGCEPVHTVTLAAHFKKENQTLVLANSVIAAISRRTEEDFGHEDLAYALASETGAPRWISFTAGSEPYRAIPVGLVTDGKTRSFAFELQQAQYIPAKESKDAITLTALATAMEGHNGDNILPASERSRNDRSYASYIAKPKALLWSKVQNVQFDYKFVGKASMPSGDQRLKDLAFADCSNGNFHVLVSLVDGANTEVAKLKIRLGLLNEFKDGCVDTGLSGSNLMKNPDRRVEVSKMPGKLLTIAETQQVFPRSYVRSLSLVVETGAPAKADNYKVTLNEANVDGVKAMDFLRVVSLDSYKKISKLPVTGRRMVISEVNAPINKPVVELEDHQIQNVKDQFWGQLPATLKTGVAYRIDFCLFGGRCLPSQGFFTLPKD